MLLQGIIDNISCTRVDKLSTGVSELIPATGVETAFTEPSLPSVSWSFSLLLFAFGLVPAPTDPSFSRRLFAVAVRCEYFFFTLEAAGTASGLTFELFFALPFVALLGFFSCDCIASSRIS